MRKNGRFGLQIVGGMATLVATVGVAAILIMDARVAGSVVARPLGWLAPLVAVSVIVGVGWILLSQRRSNEASRPTFDRIRCPACEREVLGQWRMCPYCGGMLDRASASTSAATGSSAVDN